MKAKELKKKYLDYFKSQGHAVIPSASLIPENDPTVLFTTAGMHPLVHFLMGQPHPLGKRITDVQKCMRTDDIEEVGDNIHHTFFEMLGNWSFGDYFKKEAIKMSFEFLTKKLKLPKERLAVTCFAGDKNAPKDEESAKAWLNAGIPSERIAFLPKKSNWWGPAGETGPCGPDTEMFYWSGKEPTPKKFDSDNNKWVEIWNDVFMQYNKTKEGKFLPLKMKCVDTGLGVERVAAVLQGYDDNYRTELFWPIIQKVEEITKQKYGKKTKEMRVIADHIRAAVFILGDERSVVPSNVDQGYILRRFIRRIIRHAHQLKAGKEFCQKLAEVVINIYGDDYLLLKEKKRFILQELKKEEEKFAETLENGLKVSNQFIIKDKEVQGKDAFLLFQSFGFPLEMTKELAEERGAIFTSGTVKSFNFEQQKHQELSRVGAEQKFKGGLSDASAETTKLHTATHLLNEALRRKIYSDIAQKGSNITPERLRFDFNFDRKLTPEEIKSVEDEVNRMIKQGVEVKKEEMLLKEAFKSGAHGEFGTKYPEKVSVYSIGNYSKEICMGPHVKNTKELGRFKIVKEESSSAGVRRIKAVLVKG